MESPNATPHPTRTKVVAGVVLAGIAIACLVFSKATLFALLLVLVLVASGEFFRLARRRGVRPYPLVGFVAVAAFFAIAYGDAERLPRQAPAVVAGTLVVAAMTAVLRRHREGATLGVATTVLGAVSVGLLGSYMVVLRELGFRVVLVFGLMVILNDAGAFFSGRSLGRHPMMPGISPDKSWEGLAGGTLATLIVALIAAWKLSPPFTLGRSLILGVLVAVAAPAGDAIESAMKRDAGLKDSGGAIPGHGGALDRLDSLLVSAPVFYYALQAMIR